MNFFGEHAVILLLLGLAAFFSEKSGALNIGLEGMFLLGNWGVALAWTWTQSLFFSVLFVFFIHSVWIIFFFRWIEYRRVDPFLVGLALNTLVLAFLQAVHYYQGQNVWLVGSWGLDTLLLFENIFLVSLLCVVGLLWFFWNRSSLALRWRLMFDEANLLEHRGISSKNYRFSASLLSAFWVSLASLFFVFSLGRYTYLMGLGQGWLALVVLYVGFQCLQGLVLSAWLLGGLLAWSLRWQEYLPATWSSALAYGFFLCAYLFVLFLRRIQEDHRKKSSKTSSLK